MVEEPLEERCGTQANEAHKMKRKEANLQRAITQANNASSLLDRLLTCVPGPDSDGYKLAKILKIAEEWQNIR